MNEIFYFCLLLINIITSCLGGDVLGCGGFIKSHVAIDFSNVEVKMYTKQGILKDRTSCAPNNGYYFLPVYDKGEYVIKLDPPSGWSFTPTEINIVVDGSTDLCSQGKDINFVFKGFGITGKVEVLASKGEGPAGVSVYLKSNTEMRTTTTGAGGVFFFTPVYPGSYIVGISHPRWKIAKGSVDVKVTEGNTELPPQSLTIKGYDVVGYVKSKGEPVKGAIFAILGQRKEDKDKLEVYDCDKSPIKDLGSDILCHVPSNEEGSFTFPSVSPGHYKVVPFFKEQKLHFRPSYMEFTVDHDTVILSSAFEIIGFSISGKVVDSENGQPVSGAKIYLNEKEIAVTKKDGLYTLEKIQAGTYNFKVSADNMLFQDRTLKVVPSMEKLPDIAPFSYEVCGTVISEVSQVVKVTNVETTHSVLAQTDSADGKFCKFLRPGKYHVSVSVSNTEKEDGLLFFPLSRTIEVTTKPMFDITFSQLKATVSGKVQCIRESDCRSLVIILRPSFKDLPAEDKDIIVDVVGGEYQIDDVTPGNYQVFPSIGKLCWEKDKHTILISSSSATVPVFKHTGYSTTFFSSHDTSLKYRYRNESTETRLRLKRGKSIECLKQPGTYEFVLDSCHTYKIEKFSYDTHSENNEIYLRAEKHSNIVAIESAKNHGPIFISAEVDGEKTDKGPLKFDQGLYVLELQLSPEEKVILIPRSDSLYFTPPLLTLSGENDCVDHGVVMIGIEGKIFQGQVTPPLSGIIVSLETEKEILTTETNNNGKYRFPPQDESKQFAISAKKDSYVLVGPDKQGNFQARKLAELNVRVLDEKTNLPLQGALLSLSGGESYRSNLQTNQDGAITFHSLRPNEYFLRPMMKEYSFEPLSKIIDIEEGATVHVLLKGKRVAYSALGEVTSLNGEPEDNLNVVAEGTGNCSLFSEEASLEIGKFRIRGLQPYCSYEIKVRTNSENSVIERSSPSTISIQRVTEDVVGLKFITFREMTTTDILVKVYAVDAEHYKTLRIKISRESHPASVVYTSRLDSGAYKVTNGNNFGILVQTSSIPLDGKSYSVRLESTVPQSKTQTQYIISNSTFKYVEFHFTIKATTADQQVKQTSIWAFVFIFGFIFATYNAELVYNFIRDQFSRINNTGPVGSTKQKIIVLDTPVDTNEIDQIVQSINAVKRKNKPKKI